MVRTDDDDEKYWVATWEPVDGKHGGGGLSKRNQLIVGLVVGIGGGALLIGLVAGLVMRHKHKMQRMHHQPGSHGSHGPHQPLNYGSGAGGSHHSQHSQYSQGR
jgi:hypothetical protein